MLVNQANVLFLFQELPSAFSSTLFTTFLVLTSSKSREGRFVYAKNTSCMAFATRRVPARANTTTPA